MPNQTLSMSQEMRLHQVMAPQLRQSLEMLQAPALELRNMIQAEMEQNPTLEEEPTDATPIEVEPGATEPNADTPEEKTRMDFRKEFDILARLDDEWKEYFFQEEGSRPYTTEDADRRKFFFDSIVQNTSLQEHLMQQLALVELNEADHRLGELLVGSINEDGYLTNDLQEIAASASVDLDHAHSVLAMIQEFDPPGVGAKDLCECLRLQLERIGHSHSLALTIVNDHLERLGAKRHQDTARILKVPVEEIQTAATLIATLNPKPGRAYSADLSPYITPEILVKKVDGEYLVILNDDQLPRIRISKQYRTLMNDDHTDGETRKYITEKVRASVFLLKSIQQRQHTIFKIATEIVRVQRDFLDQGIAHLKPLIMADVAQAVGLHETTVSRAVSAKYMQTPRGVFEMKYFFNPGLRAQDGTVLSNKTVQDMIASMVAAESPTQPLADQDIMEALTQKGIQIARRTIAKYRIALRIPPSHQRKTH